MSSISLLCLALLLPSQRRELRVFSPCWGEERFSNSSAFLNTMRDDLVICEECVCCPDLGGGGGDYCTLGLGSHWRTHLRHIVPFFLLTLFLIICELICGGGGGGVEEDAAAAVLMSASPLYSSLPPSVFNKTEEKSDIPLFPSCWFKPYICVWLFSSF